MLHDYLGLLNQFHLHKQKAHKSSFYLYNNLQSSFASLRLVNEREKEIQVYENLISGFESLAASSKKINEKTSKHYNLFKLIKLKETTHSFLLAHLLNPLASHGQGKHFLIHFLNILEIKNPEKGEWVVTAENGRVDILIKRLDPHSVIVIENKSNNAGDQLNQLYRYWYHQIYYPKKDYGYTYAQNFPEYYKVLYLTPTDDKEPSPDTITRPENWSIELPERMPLSPLIWTFQNEIVLWLEKALEDVAHKENYRLKENIKQYIDFWK